MRQVDVSRRSPPGRAVAVGGRVSLARSVVAELAGRRRQPAQVSTCEQAGQGLPDHRDVLGRSRTASSMGCAAGHRSRLRPADAGPSRRCPGPGCAARRPGTARPGRRSGLVGQDRGQVAVGEPARGGGLARAPGPPRRRRAGRPAATASAILARTREAPAAAASASHSPAPSPDRQELRLGAVPRPSACGPARRAAPAGSARRRPAGCPAWSPGAGPPRPGRPARHG